MKELTPKQMKFCQNYHLTSNATQSVIDAGYSEKGADVMGSRLLGNARVKDELDRLKRETSSKYKVARSDMVDILMDIAQSKDSTPRDKISSVTQICKMMGFNEPEKQEISGKLDVVMSYNVVTDRESAHKILEEK